jgi:NADH dehydrogenase
MTLLHKVPKIVIVGCGFGGLALAKKLSKLEVDILIIDKNNYHVFQPLLYQVATGGLEAENIAYPVRRIFRKYRNVCFRMAEAISVNEARHEIKTSIGTIPYDFLVLAMGSTNNFFSFEPVREKMLPLKSLLDAFNLRSFIMQNLERALITEDGLVQEEIVNIAIIGGGPAGIELAGAIAEMKKFVLPLDFPELNLSRMHIYLFEAAPRLLSTMSAKASGHAYRYLEKMGVKIHLAKKVIGYDGHRLTLENGENVRTDTVIWTAGVKPVTIAGLHQAGALPGGRLPVDEFNKVKNSIDVFAIGDMASFGSETNPKGLPMLAPVAIQQARHLAENIKLQLSGKPLTPFVYKNKGVMATIGRKRAVVDFPNWSFKGLFAWFVWMFIHVMSIIGFRNKLMTLIDWAGSYLSYDKPLGIIIPDFKKAE